MKLVRKYIFFLLLILLPVNLGKHLDIPNAYISGIVVDYLVPVIYVQDILAGILVFLWFLSFSVKQIFPFTKTTAFLVFFIFSVFLSFLVSEFPLTSFIYFLRILLYVLVGFYVYSNKNEPKDFEFKDALCCISIGVFYSALLGLAQFINQGSVFNNYLILGEQPYGNGLKAILKERFFNTYVIPPYSLFRHPNTFAGFLSLLLPFLWVSFSKKNNWFWIVFSLSLVNLLFTFSAVAITSLVISFILIFLIQKRRVLNNLDIFSLKGILIPSTIGIGSLLLPLFTGISLFKSTPSVYRRIELLMGAYNNLGDYLPFGIGIGTSTSLFKSSVFLTRDLSFFQPVHNIFILITLESGLIALVTLLGFMFYLYKNNVRNHSYLFVFFIQLVLIGSFDHYLITMHQTLLVVCILFGFILHNRHLLGKK